MGPPDVSIAIPTRNRASHLAKTLRNLSKVEPPPGVRVEVVVIDNGSSDGTAALVTDQVVSWCSSRLLREPLAGVSRARNLAIQETQSPLLVFLDDDVRPDGDWLIRMVKEFEDPDLMVVGGGIELDRTICPEWMEPWHHVLFASTEFPRLTGEKVRSANIGFRRACFESGVKFDPEIGAGTEYGFAEEYLLIQGLRQNGLRVKLNRDVRVVHEFDPSRLDAQALIKIAVGTGRSGAYVTYHYGNRLPRLLSFRERVLRCRSAHVRDSLEATGMRPDEQQFKLIQRAACYAQFLIERTRNPNYRFPDPQKIAGVLT